MKMQDLLHAIYPPHCITCDGAVDKDFSFCPACWGATPLVLGTLCSACGLPLMGEAGEAPLCDDCLQDRPIWTAARAALFYQDNARSMILALKHCDRPELARPAGRLMSNAARDMIPEIEMADLLVAPIPLHWTRMLWRLYNQSALLSDVIADRISAAHCVDLLLRKRRTLSQNGRDKRARFANVKGAIAVNPRHNKLVFGRNILLIDDVMTSGATFSAAAEACFAAGAQKVYVLALARVAKDA